MEEINKQLLLKDLCERLPYHPQIYVYVEDIDGSCEFNEPLWTIDTEAYLVNDKHISEDIKPYLRPMSSMTEEERKEIGKFIFVHHHEWDGTDTSTSYIEKENIGRYFDWLNAHHFDYRGLIPMGLALEAKEGMYKIE